MNRVQRILLVIFGLLTMWFSFNVTFDQYGTSLSRPWLATFLWLASLAMFLVAAKGKPNP